MPLFEYRDVDRMYYQREIRDFLPTRIIDVHTHVYCKCFRLPGGESGTDRSQSWPDLVAEDNPVEDLLETYRILLPEQDVTPVMFAQPSLGYDVDANNSYIAECGRRHDFPALYLSRPEESACTLEEKITAGGFKGIKVYLNFSPGYIPPDEIRIFDFLPRNQLEMLDAKGLVVMLHIPRPGRLRDEVNLAQLLEIDKRYPRLKLIVAHVGRAYALEDVGNALERLADTRMWFDFSANTNRQVFEKLLKVIGPKRIMFGSDLPILRMRMRRVVENGRYINIVPKGLYGDISGEAHMREAEGSEADRLSFFLYEEIAAMRRAAEACSLARGDVEALFYRTAAGLFDVRQNSVTEDIS